MSARRCGAGPSVEANDVNSITHNGVVLRATLDRALVAVRRTLPCAFKCSVDSGKEVALGQTVRRVCSGGDRGGPVECTRLRLGEGRAGHLLLGWCLFMWSAKWSERAKERSQMRHLNGLAPVCFR